MLPHPLGDMTKHSRLCPLSTSWNYWVVLFYILIEMMSPPDKSPAQHCNWISGCLLKWSTAGLHLPQHPKHKGPSLSNSILIRSGHKKPSDYGGGPGTEVQRNWDRWRNGKRSHLPNFPSVAGVAINGLCWCRVSELAQGLRDSILMRHMWALR